MKRTKKLFLTIMACAVICFSAIGFITSGIAPISAEAAKCSHSGGTATCTEKPICEDCGKTYGKALGHDYEKHDAQAATCEEIGWKSYKTCTREGCDYSTYKVIPALGHKGKATCLEEAACTRKGCGELYKADCTGGKATCTTLAKCKWCGEEYGDYVHSWKKVKAQAVSCTKDGWVEHQQCKKCGVTAIDGEVTEIEITPA